MLASLVAIVVCLLACDQAWAQALSPVEAPVRVAKVAPTGTWTLVALPDTQYYTRDFPDVFYRQTAWIALNRKHRDIRFVAHEGDITSRNSRANWRVARRAFDTLNKAEIPYALVPGNHDLGKAGKTDSRDTYMNEFFSPKDYVYGADRGFFETGKVENSWQTFDTPWGPFMVLALEFGPRQAVVEWADAAIKGHPDHTVVLVTHAYLLDNSHRNHFAGSAKDKKGNPKNYGIKADANDGEELWQKLVSPNKNVRMVLNGHVCGTGAGYLMSVGEKGQRVHQLLANYQDNGGNGGTVYPQRGYGGGGYLRLMEFLPDKKTVRVRSYSPWYDHWLTEKIQQFELEW